MSECKVETSVTLLRDTHNGGDASFLHNMKTDNRLKVVLNPQEAEVKKYMVGLKLGWSVIA